MNLKWVSKKRILIERKREENFHTLRIIIYNYRRTLKMCRIVEVKQCWRAKNSNSSMTTSESKVGIADLLFDFLLPSPDPLHHPVNRSPTWVIKMARRIQHATRVKSWALFPLLPLRHCVSAQRERHYARGFPTSFGVNPPSRTSCFVFPVPRLTSWFIACSLLASVGSRKTVTILTSNASHASGRPHIISDNMAHEENNDEAWPSL